jgi:hypothetical protein
MRRIGIDTETYLINAEQGIVAPRMVCLTYCTEDADVGLLGRDDALALMHALLDADDIEFVAHHARFDFSVLCAADATLLPKVFRAYDEGRVRCTMVREKLLALARGELADEGDTGAKRNVRFSLAACVERRFSIDLSEAKTAKGGPLPWRMRFSELDGIPVEAWPVEARDYALDDAKYNLALFDAQTMELNEQGATGNTIPDEAPQTRAAFWLYLMSVRGVRTDPQRVNRLDTALRAEYARINALVRAADVLKPKMQKGEMVWSKNMTALRGRVVSAYGGEEHTPMTGGGKKGVPAISTAREHLLAPIDKAVLKWVEDLEQQVFAARAERGEPEMEGEEAAALSRELAYAAAEAHGLDGERVYNWLVLHAVAERSGVEKLLKTYVPTLLQGTQFPVTPTFNELVASGRTSSVKPNLQNPPRKGGIRECFIPRPGYYYAFCDYSFIELCTLAQSCLEYFGWSHMADAINAGLDPHLDMAASMLGIDYEEAKRRKKADDPQIAEYRQLSKCFHPDTEVLARSGWKRISDLAPGEAVAAAEPSYGGHIALSWQVPSQVFSKPSPGSLIHLKNEGIDLRVTDDHRMLAFCNARGKVGSPKVVMPEEMGSVRHWANAGVLNGGALVLDENLLRLAVATQADGNYPVGGRQIRFGFTKQRKIDRMLVLLAPHAGCYTVSRTSQGATQIVLDAVLADKVRPILDRKMFPVEWLDLAPACREAVLDEVPHWGGHVRENWTMWKYTSTLQQNVEVLQALATLSGRKTRVTSKAASGNHAEQYEISVERQHLTRGGNLSIKRIAYEGEVVCLSVASSYVVVRDGGVPVVTGQCLNFGYPGGLGAAKFVEYARAGYGVILSETEARRRKEEWYRKWPEMRLYHQLFSSMALGDAEFDVVQPGSGRVRGKCFYTAACNTIFQGRAADGAKRAGWYLAQECYLGYGKLWPDDGRARSPLYGSRPVLFVHDEFILEVPETTAHEATLRQSEVMVAGMKEVVPDVKVGTEYAIARRWYKGAGAAYDENKRLVPWEPKEKKA